MYTKKIALKTLVFTTLFISLHCSIIHAATQPVNYYEKIGISPTATGQEVTAACQIWLKENRDLAGGWGFNARVCQILEDPITRHVYDSLSDEDRTSYHNLSFDEEKYFFYYINPQDRSQYLHLTPGERKNFMAQNLTAEEQLAYQYLNMRPHEHWYHWSRLTQEQKDFLELGNKQLESRKSRILSERSQENSISKTDTKRDSKKQKHTNPVHTKKAKSQKTGRKKT